MPFTLSHIAAVVPAYRPLSRARLFTAAVIGSMAPDFGEVLSDTLARWKSHSLPALVTFCLPMGLLAYAITLWLIKPALLEVLPNRAYARVRSQEGRTLAEEVHESVEQATGTDAVLSASTGTSARIRSEAATARGPSGESAAPSVPALSWLERRRWLAIPLVLLLGSFTHLLWDAFTHEDTRGVRWFPQLLDYAPQVAGHSLQLYQWLQYGSSVVGLVVVIGALALWMRHASAVRPAPPRRLRAAERSGWLVAYFVLPLAALVWYVLRPLHEFLPLGAVLEDGALQCLRATLLSLLMVSALLRLRLLS